MCSSNERPDEQVQFGPAAAARIERRRPLQLLACAIVAEVAASLAMQAAVDRPWWYVAVVIGYAIGFILLVLILKSGMAIGVAYGIWGASGVALTALSAAFLFGQIPSATTIAGIALVAAGVIMVESGSQRAQRSIAQESA
mgnify:CR=1 FL=1